MIIHCAGRTCVTQGEPGCVLADCCKVRVQHLTKQVRQAAAVGIGRSIFIGFVSGSARGTAGLPYRVYGEPQSIEISDIFGCVYWR